ncbi:hypothetical protein ACFWNN_23135 [Lentzea sp. NPDC058450]|uniref:hypothetical protein n=1 Tax=Lentzea sp. NPDC058450 TaxID=3346505 RepID=UPI00364C2843
MFTDELRWEPFDWAGPREFVRAVNAMAVCAETRERVRTAQWDGVYALVFEEFQQCGDLMRAKYLLRYPDGTRAVEEEWRGGGDWGMTFRQRDVIREHNWYDVELPVTEAEAREYMRLHDEWSRLQRRAYGRPGN